jgi:hypothetical protein
MTWFGITDGVSMNQMEVKDIKPHLPHGVTHESIYTVCIGTTPVP